MAQDKQKIYGLLAKFEQPEDLLKATRRVYGAGYRKFDSYTPYPIEGLGRAMGLGRSGLEYVMLIGGILGGSGAFLMMVYATMIDNPWNIGGRPLFSWPAYIPITFELTVLLAAFFGIGGLFAVTRFPQPYHPLFNSQDFREHGSQDAFYIGIEASDPKFNLENTRSFLESLGAVQVTEVEA